jgi:PadR family transcriptional regulator PadR
LLTSRIVPSYSGPPRRYYRITEQGRSVLAEWKLIWRATRDFVDRFTEPEASLSSDGLMASVSQGEIK